MGTGILKRAAALVAAAGICGGLLVGMTSGAPASALASGGTTLDVKTDCNGNTNSILVNWQMANWQAEARFYRTRTSIYDVNRRVWVKVGTWSSDVIGASAMKAYRLNGTLPDGGAYLVSVEVQFMTSFAPTYTSNLPATYGYTYTYGVARYQAAYCYT